MWREGGRKDRWISVVPRRREGRRNMWSTVWREKRGGRLQGYRGIGGSEGGKKGRVEEGSVKGVHARETL